MSPAALSGTVQNDILKEYIARGTYIYPPAASLRIVTDIFAYCEREVPQWNTISISGYHIREAGSTAVQEVAFTFANAIAYVSAAVAAGLDVNAFGQRLSFFFNAHNDFLEEVAKFRAARRLWARIMRDRFGATNPRALQLRFHTQTAGSTLTAQQPDNNIVRVAVQAMAAVLGGTQSLHTNGRDEALALPTEESARIALRTQQIIAHESGVAEHGGPVRRLVARRAADQRHRGGRARAARAHRGAGRHAARPSKRDTSSGRSRSRPTARSSAIDAGTDVVVGVNRFATDDRPTVAVFALDPDVERRQVAKLQALRAARSQTAWRAALDAVGRRRRGQRQPGAAPSSPPSRPRPRSAKLRIRCAACSASSARSRLTERLGGRQAGLGDLTRMASNRCCRCRA